MEQKNKFKNWAGNVDIAIPHIAQPTSEDEICVLVHRHQNIRLSGTAHSWSNHFETNGLLMKLDNYRKIIAVDTVKKTIKVQGGIKLWQLNDELDKHGLAMANLGSIDRQSIAGAISTGTHGTGINFQCLASQVLEFALIDANGEKRLFQRGTDEFNGAVINLGTLGVISEVTLQLTDAFNLRDHTFTLDFEEAIERLDEFVHRHDHFKIWWLPPAKKAVLFTYKRTNEPRNDSRLRQILNDEVVSVLGYRLLVKIGNLNPQWRKPINTFLTSTYNKPLNRIEKSYKVFRVPEPPKHRETEWAFDLKDGREILRAYRKLFTESNFTFNFIQEIRFTKSDDFWLSECYGRNTIWIGAYNHFDWQWKDILQSFEAFAIAHNGRPHWGKEFNVRHHELKKMYPKFSEFIDFKNRLDPSGKFSNRLMCEIFS